jgi:hypothetical protein
MNFIASFLSSNLICQENLTWLHFKCRLTFDECHHVKWWKFQSKPSFLHSERRDEIYNLKASFKDRKQTIKFSFQKWNFYATLCGDEWQESTTINIIFLHSEMGKWKDFFMTFLSLASSYDKAFLWHYTLLVLSTFFRLTRHTAFNHELMDELFFDLTFSFILLLRGNTGADNNIIHRIFGADLQLLLCVFGGKR